MKIAVAGTGYVGLSMAVLLAQHNRVTAVDILPEKVDMIIHLENWDSSKIYDRMGMGNEFGDILGVEIPLITIPVKPGRNIAVIIEVAAMNNRQKKLGYNATHELLASLGMDADAMPPEPKKVYKDWITRKS